MGKKEMLLSVVVAGLMASTGFVKADEHQSAAGGDKATTEAGAGDAAGCKGGAGCNKEKAHKGKGAAKKAHKKAEKKAEEHHE